jgi:hypothetical protein
MIPITRLLMLVSVFHHEHDESGMRIPAKTLIQGGPEAEHLDLTGIPSSSDLSIGRLHA